MITSLLPLNSDHVMVHLVGYKCAFCNTQLTAWKYDHVYKTIVLAPKWFITWSEVGGNKEVNTDRKDEVSDRDVSLIPTVFLTDSVKHFKSRENDWRRWKENRTGSKLLQQFSVVSTLYARALCFKKWRCLTRLFAMSVTKTWRYTRHISRNFSGPYSWKRSCRVTNRSARSN